MKKYEFTGETKNFLGTTLRRIRRISDGLVGGWIEKEGNLSQDGDARVSGDALVSGNALVYGNARVSGDARVYGNAWVFGDARVSSPSDILHMVLSGIPVTYCRGGWLSVGCQAHSIDNAFWDKSAAEIQAEHGDRYADFMERFGEGVLDLCLALEEKSDV